MGTKESCDPRDMAEEEDHIDIQDRSTCELYVDDPGLRLMEIGKVHGKPYTTKE